MSHRLLAAFAAAALLALGWWLASENSPADPRLVEVALEEPAPAPEAEPPSSRTMPAEHVDRADDAQPLPAERGFAVAFRGTCVAAEERTPLQGCVVRLVQPASTLRGGRSEIEIARTLSDARGAFLLRADAPQSAFEIQLDATGRCRASLRYDGAKLPASMLLAEGEDLGAVPLHRCRLVRGRIIDESGAPFGSVILRAVGEHGVVLDEPRSASLIFQVDAEGRFAYHGRVPEGTYRLEIFPSKAGAVQTPQSLDVSMSTEPLELDVVVARHDPPPRLEGRVALAGSTASPSIDLTTLELTAISPAKTYRVRPDVQGSFLIAAVAGDSGPLELHVARGAVEAYRHPSPVEWNAQDLRLDLVPAGTLRLAVVETDTGEPIERFAAFCVPMEGGLARQPFVWPEPAKHPGGTCTLVGVPSGDCELHVWAADPLFDATQKVSFRKADGETPSLRVEIEPRTTREVLVRNAAGRPIADAQIELIDPGSANTIEIQTVLYFEPGTSDPPRLLAGYRTNAEGRARIIAPRSPQRLALRVRAPGEPPSVWNDVDLAPAEAPLELTLPLGAAILGTLDRRDIEARTQLKVCLGSPAEPSLSNAWEQLALSADVSRYGAFRIQGVPAGSWTLYARESARARPVELTRVDVGLGEVKDLGTLQPEPLRRGHLIGRVIWQTAQVRGFDLKLRLPYPLHGSGPIASLALPRDGRYALEYIVPGRYDLVLSCSSPRDDGHCSLTYPGEIDLVAGKRSNVDWLLRARAFRFRAIASDGSTPLVMETLESGDVVGAQIRVRTDRQGYADVKLAPLGELRMRREADLGAIAIIAAGVHGDLGDLVFRVPD